MCINENILYNIYKWIGGSSQKIKVDRGVLVQGLSKARVIATLFTWFLSVTH